MEQPPQGLSGRRQDGRSQVPLLRYSVSPEGRRGVCWRTLIPSQFRAPGCSAEQPGAFVFRADNNAKQLHIKGCVNRSNWSPHHDLLTLVTTAAADVWALAFS